MLHLPILLYLLHQTVDSLSVSSQDEAICVKKSTPATPKISLKATTFTQLIEDSDVFVDKSLFIKAFLETHHNVLVITCPSKWGKSINLDMLKTFVQLQVDEKGDKIKPSKTSRNNEIFKKGQITGSDNPGENLKSPMLIAKEKDVFAHQGKHPVIYFSYQNINGDMFSKVVNSTLTALSFTFKKHQYMESVLKKIIAEKSGTKKEQEAREDLDKFCKFLYEGEYNETEIVSSLRFLTRILYQHFGKPVYVFVDDYETPFMKMFDDKEFMRIYRPTVLEFFGELFKNTFNDNQCFGKALITGRLHVFGEYLFSGIHNVSQYNMMHNPYSHFYGFTRGEIEMLYDHVDMDYHLIKEATRWYQGYKTGEVSRQPVSNPQSIAIFVNDRIPRSYWETSDTFFLLDSLKVDKMRQIYEWLVHDNNIAFTRQTIHLDLPEVVHIKEVVTDKQYDLVKSYTTELIVSRLCDDGFFTYSGTKFVESRNATVTLLKLPNAEVHDEIANRLLWAYQMQDGISCWTMNRICEHLNTFIHTSSTTSVNLYKAFENLFGDMEIYARKATRKNKHKTATSNVKIARAILNYLAVQMSIQYQYKVNITLLPHMPIETPVPDLVLFRNQTVALMKIKYNYPSSKGVYQQIKDHAYAYNNSEHIRWARVIAIGVGADHKPEIYAHTYKF